MIATGLFVLLLVGLAYLLRQLSVQGALLTALQHEQQTLSEALQAQPLEPEQVLPASGTPLIAIAILNPVELASRQSSLASTINNFAPDYIQRLVYQRTAEVLREQMAEQGVQAEVTVYGLD